MIFNSSYDGVISFDEYKYTEVSTSKIRIIGHFLFFTAKNDDDFRTYLITH